MKRITDKSRREFLKKLIAGTSLVGLAPYMLSMEGCNYAGSTFKIPQRPFGKTGATVGIYSLGAQATVEQVGMKDLVARDELTVEARIRRAFEDERNAT